LHFLVETCILCGFLIKDIDYFHWKEYNENNEYIILIFFLERMFEMNLAKVTSAGQITVPVEIRRLLKLRAGDKILFTQNDAGEIVIGNASINAIYKAQKAFEGVADALGNPGEEEIQSWVNEVRYGKGEAL
jgi:AbrB family looped-hinge helix DNA binding protein